jgi:hypothetical protein
VRSALFATGGYDSSMMDCGDDRYTSYSSEHHHGISVVRSTLFATEGYDSSTADCGDNRYRSQSLECQHNISMARSALFATRAYDSGTPENGDTCNRYKYKSYRLRTPSNAEQNSHSLTLHIPRPVIIQPFPIPPLAFHAFNILQPPHNNFQERLLQRLNPSFFGFPHLLAPQTDNV